MLPLRERFSRPSRCWPSPCTGQRVRGTGSRARRRFPVIGAHAPPPYHLNALGPEELRQEATLEQDLHFSLGLKADEFRDEQAIIE